VIFAQSSCKNNVEKDKTRQTGIYQEQNKALDYLIDSVLIEFNPYSLCGSFYSELSDSFINDNLDFCDSLLNKEDMNYMVEQYNLYKEKNIDYIIDTSRFIRIDTLLNYKGSNFFKLHIALSPPLFSINEKYCLVYSHVFTDKGQSSAFFFLENTDNEWKFLFHFLPNGENLSENIHYHDYSLILHADVDQQHAHGKD
jgi:hypothetical protein